MKLVKLALAGFGPFREEQAVDFGPCNEAGLFMVAGPTGSGKTTLLDAIAFALYGETTGAGQGSGEVDGRKAADVRCTACTPDEPTFVELEFEVSGQLLKVRRNPSYERSARRGGGTAEQAADVSVQRSVDGEWTLVPGLRRISETNAFLESLLGLTAEQFRRVVVIPQGRFREVLLSEPNERQELLKRIFGTHLYERFTELVKERAAAGERALKSLESQRKAVVGELDWAVGLDPAAVRDEAARRRDAAVAAQHAAEEAVKDRDARLGLAAGALADAQAGNERVAAVRRAEAECGAARAAIAALAPKRAEFDEARRVGSAARAIRAAEQAEQARMKATEQLQAAQQAVRPLEEALQQAILAKATADEILLQDEQRLGAEQAGIEVALPALRARASALEEGQKRVESLRGRLQAEESTCTATRAKAAAAGEAHAAVDQALARARIDHRANRAGLLAKDLRPGCACPVCGSERHPVPASLPAVVVDDDALAELEAAETKARKAKDAAVSAEQKAVATHDATVNELREFEAALAAAGLGDLARITQSIEAQGARLEAIRRTIKELAASARVAGAAESQSRKACTDAEGAVKHAAGVAEAAAAVVAAATTARDAELARIGERDVQRVKAADRPADWIAGAEREITDVARRLASAEGGLATAQSAAGTAVHRDLLPLEADVVTWRDQRDAARTAAVATAGEVALLDQLVQKLESLAASAADAESQLRPAHELAQVVLGATGEMKVSLHTWVLGAFLDEVLAAASRRMRDMTRGRYELHRMREQLDGRQQQAGLNVEVHDAHTGKARPARTLSGGETFLASLSMALALAEVAGARGGRALDTVFIDEGFGTLDAETLDVAMGVLTQLRDAGRTVGLISHVDEMKRRIPAGISVRKDPGTGLSRVVQG